jgi:hypothetical protein
MKTDEPQISVPRYGFTPKLTILGLQEKIDIFDAVHICMYNSYGTVTEKWLIGIEELF